MRDRRWVGTPCTSMTRAGRVGRPGAAPLRHDRYPCVVPDSDEVNQQMVSEGNLAAVSATGLEVGRQAGAFGVLENPWRSFSWGQPRVELALRRLDFGTVLLEFCQLGTCWQKRTRLDGDLPGHKKLQKL